MAQTRKATNVTISVPVLEAARALNVNISQAAELGVIRATAEKCAELWLEENREALDSSNHYVERNGLPLASYRGF